MQVPIQITFQGVVRSDVMEGCIREEWEALSDIGLPITSSAVIVTQPRDKHFSGDPCRLRVHLAVEGGPDINVNYDPARANATTPCAWPSETPSALCDGAWKIWCAEAPLTARTKAPRMSASCKINTGLYLP